MSEKVAHIIERYLKGKYDGFEGYILFVNNGKWGYEMMHSLSLDMGFLIETLKQLAAEIDRGNKEIKNVRYGE
jgi:hypothetical protein